MHKMVNKGQSMDVDRLLTAEQVCEELKNRGLEISSRTLRQMAKDGRFIAPIEVHGNKLMWTISDIDKWLEIKKSNRANYGA